MDKVTEEIALDEFDRFTDEMGLDVSEQGLSTEEVDGIAKMKRTFIKAVMRGDLVVDEQGQPVFTSSEGGESLTFHEPKGASLVDMFQGKSGVSEIVKMNRLMGSMTKTHAKVFANMRMRDLKVAQAIVGLFMG